MLDYTATFKHSGSTIGSTTGMTDGANVYNEMLSVAEFFKHPSIALNALGVTLWDEIDITVSDGSSYTFTR